MEIKVKHNQVYQYLKEDEARKKLLIAIRQPVTATQLAKKTGIPANTCSYLISQFSARGLLSCLNENAQKSRVYWLTELGIQCQKHLYQDSNLPYKDHILPEIDWDLYGWLNFNHRSVVIKVLTRPMQPSELKRFIRLHQPNIKISANNIRDIMKLFLDKEIVRPVKIKKKAHLRYELTDLGIKLRAVLMQADAAI